MSFILNHYQEVLLADETILKQLLKYSLQEEKLVMVILNKFVLSIFYFGKEMKIYDCIVFHLN